MARAPALKPQVAEPAWMGDLRNASNMLLGHFYAEAERHLRAAGDPGAEALRALKAGGDAMRVRDLIRCAMGVV